MNLTNPPMAMSGNPLLLLAATLLNQMSHYNSVSVMLSKNSGCNVLVSLYLWTGTTILSSFDKAKLFLSATSNDMFDFNHEVN
jgi:hypothetical protein